MPEPEAQALTRAERVGERLALGLRDTDTVAEAQREALRERVPEGEEEEEREALGCAEVVGLREGERLAEGERVGEALAEGVCEARGDALSVAACGSAPGSSAASSRSKRWGRSIACARGPARGSRACEGR